MYSNKFVACVLIDGRPAKEFANGTVNLPFGTEYSLRFRNKHNRRAVVKIFLDGANVSETGYVIPARGSVDIHRHALEDRAFKFVSLDSEEAIDHGKNGPNNDKKKGLVEARFYLEKKPSKVVEKHHHHHYPPNPWKPWGPYWGPIYGSGGTIGSSYTCNTSNTASTEPRKKSILRSCGFPGHTFTDMGDELLDLEDGCTVEGGSTGQMFATVYVDLETTFTSVKLFLQGFNLGVQKVQPKKRDAHGRYVKNRESLETENEKLRLKLAELENADLKRKIADAS